MIEKVDTIKKWCVSQFDDEYKNWLSDNSWYIMSCRSHLNNYVFNTWELRHDISIEVLANNAYNKLIPFDYIFCFRYDEDRTFFKMRWC